MTDKQLFFLALAILCLGVLIVGAIGGDCVAECEATGRTLARCYQICRP